MGARIEDMKAWDTKQRLIRQNGDLEMATRVGYDMEGIAVDIKTNLEGQREKLGHITENINRINGDTRQSNRHLNEIKASRARNRLIIYGVIGVIASALVITFACKILL
jgi:t-SNARE complex subunit (syntaxin)